MTPTKEDLIETHENIISMARQLILNKAGIAPSSMVNVLNTMGEGRQNVGFIDKDIQNVF